MNTLDANILLTRIGTVWSTVVPSVEKAQTWATVLSDVTLDEASRALAVHMKIADQPPMPVHLRTIVREARIQAGQRQTITEQARHVCPRPDNFDAMTKAWNDPVAFAAERTKYFDQLREAGHADCIRSTS